MMKHSPGPLRGTSVQDEIAGGISRENPPWPSCPPSIKRVKNRMRFSPGRDSARKPQVRFTGKKGGSFSRGPGPPPVRYEVDSEDPVARIADVILFRPAGGAGPSPAQGALAKLVQGKGTAAEIAGEARETGRVFSGRNPRFSHHRDIRPYPGEEVPPALQAGILTSGRSVLDRKSVV